MFTSIDSIQLERMGKFYYRFKFWANNCDWWQNYKRRKT
jgi:hypothetical protein